MSKETINKLENELKELSKRFKAIVSKIDEMINFYFDYGWFFDYDFPLDNHIYKILKEENILLDGYMSMHYNDNINEIVKLLLERFPGRSHILEKAFLAHENRDYELSIPILIIQSDGIFREITEKELFSKHDKRRAELIFSELDQVNVDTLRLASITVLKRYEEIAASLKTHVDYPNLLHRNLILHGYQNDYATETNSYKAISLINFVGKVVYDFKVANINKTN